MIRGGCSRCVQAFVAVRIVNGVIAVAGRQVQAIIERFPALDEGAVMRIAGGKDGHHPWRDGEPISQIKTPARFDFLCCLR